MDSLEGGDLSLTVTQSKGRTTKHEIKGNIIVFFRILVRHTVPFKSNVGFYLTLFFTLI